ncbi:hypothetical protein G6L37_34640 [Agrobacterium rubi]|nr:hypothetical protein [Agrobacterium rubi]NTF23706.1 hypothetical protein [Agrobacterium rubi]
MKLFDRILKRGKRAVAENSLEKARKEAWIYHDRHMRDDSDRWMGFFAPTNGMTLFTYYTANQGFSKVIGALRNVSSHLADDHSMVVAGLMITAKIEGDGEAACRHLHIRAPNGVMAKVTIRPIKEDWKTGERKASHEVSLAGVFSLTIFERLEGSSSSRSGSTSPKDYPDYVAFFDVFRVLVAETAPAGNPSGSDFGVACSRLVDADGGLPGEICLRDHSLMTAQVAGRYLRHKPDSFVAVHSAMIEKGFVAGEKKLIHAGMEMFAIPVDDEGVGRFVLSEGHVKREPFVYSFAKTGGRIAMIDIREGRLSSEPHVSLDVRAGTCRLAHPSVAHREMANGLRLIDKAQEIFCGRRIDFSAFAEFNISDDFSEFRRTDRPRPVLSAS